jgi:hypothetical protein
MTTYVNVTYQDGTSKLFAMAQFDKQRFIDFIVTQPNVVSAK